MRAWRGSSAGRLDHVNISVGNPHKTAELLETIFGWKIRWEGVSAMGGYSIHIGGEEDYIALYSPEESKPTLGYDERVAGGFNHIGIVVEDLDLIEQKVVKAGLSAHSHQDYEPGRRFYFTDEDGVEYEVVSYS